MYVGKFKEMKELFGKGDDLEIKVVVEIFGNGIRVEEVVFVVIFLFFYKGRVLFDMFINYVIFLGGDIDIIVSMVGVIIGVYWGLDNIFDLWRSKCEGVEEVIEFVNKIFEFYE